MKIIHADYILMMDAEFTILQKSGVAFEEEIIAIGETKDLKERFSDAEHLFLGPNSVLMPGLVNPHVHLEFSANKTTLTYGDFIKWLQSVILHRDTLVGHCGEICIKKVLDQILLSGTTTIGAVSSFGKDLRPCVHTPLHVVYFNEVLGSNPAVVDAMFGDFLQRLQESKKHQSPSFTPAISVHSPYSTHPILAKKALEIAKEEGMVVSTHFMESRAEREWIDEAKGDFADFFASFAPGSRPVNSAFGYLELFKEQKVLFTHATYASDEELDLMQKMGYITHCPISNRLLHNGRLALEKVECLTIGTDGLSSNISLNMWEEMRAALWMHTQIEPNLLAKRLLLAATKEGAKALGQNAGEIALNKRADLIVITLPDAVQDLDTLALQLLLHAKEAQKVFIQGELVNS